MKRRRPYAVVLGLGLVTLALVASSLGLAPDLGSTAAPVREARPPPAQQKSTVPVDFADTPVIGGLAEPVSVAFAPDGTAFIALKTGVVKSYDYHPATGLFEPAATST